MGTRQMLSHVPAPCRARANSSELLYSMHIPAELIKARAGMCQEGSAILGNTQGQEGGHSSLQCRPCVLDVGGMDVGGMRGGWGCWRGSRRMMESGCSQRRSSRSL